MSIAHSFRSKLDRMPVSTEAELDQYAIPFDAASLVAFGATCGCGVPSCSGN